MALVRNDWQWQQLWVVASFYASDASAVGCVLGDYCHRLAGVAQFAETPIQRPQQLLNLATQ
jgi:hypothetical protein